MQQPKTEQSAAEWEARRWCKGDDAWTNWQPCTAEQKARWDKTGDFQFRRAARAREGGAG